MAASQAQRLPTSKDLKVLDMACGTGLVGEKLQKFGFRQIHGCDVSPGMMRFAELKGCYKQLKELDLLKIEEFPQVLKNQYDIVTCAGLINNNHMDYRVFEEMILAAKQGGLVIFAAPHSYIGQYWYADVCSTMVEEGRWKLIETQDFFKYDKITSSIGRFSRMPMKLFVYEVLQEQRNTWITRTTEKLF